MPIRAVIFDYGMVLSHRDPVVHEKLLAITGLDYETFERFYWPGRHDYDLAIVDGPGFWNDFARRAGLNFGATQVEALVENDILLWAPLNEPMVAWATALSKAGIRTAILSNMTPDLLRHMRSSPDFTWLSDFSHLTWSCELGISKPDPKIYLYTCQALGVAPAEALFLDDKPENAAAAQALGLSAIQFTSLNDLSQELARRSLLPDDLLPNAPLPGVNGLQTQPTG